MVSELIKENRKLRRQVDKLSTKGTAAASGTIEKGLRSIQRRVQRAMGSGTSTTRRRRATSTTTRRRTTTTRRRRPTASGDGSSSSS
jgi:16S rRNA G1207 methylase RsmC